MRTVTNLFIGKHGALSQAERGSELSIIWLFYHFHEHDLRRSTANLALAGKFSWLSGSMSIYTLKIALKFNFHSSSLFSPTDVLVIVFCVPATLISNLFVREYHQQLQNATLRAHTRAILTVLHSHTHTRQYCKFIDCNFVFRPIYRELQFVQFN